MLDCYANVCSSSLSIPITKTNPTPIIVREKNRGRGCSTLEEIISRTGSGTLSTSTTHSHTHSYPLSDFCFSSHISTPPRQLEVGPLHLLILQSSGLPRRYPHLPVIMARPPIRSTDDLLLAIGEYKEIATTIFDYWEYSCSYQCSLELKWKRFKTIMNEMAVDAVGDSDRRMDGGLRFTEEEEKEVTALINDPIAEARALGTAHTLLPMLKHVARVSAFLFSDKGCAPMVARNMFHHTCIEVRLAVQHHPMLQRARDSIHPFLAFSSYDDLARASLQIQQSPWRINICWMILNLLGAFSVIHLIGVNVGIDEEEEDGVIWGLPWESWVQPRLLKDPYWYAGNRKEKGRITVGDLGYGLDWRCEWDKLEKFSVWEEEEGQGMAGHGGAWMT